LYANQSNGYGQTIFKLMQSNTKFVILSLCCNRLPEIAINESEILTDDHDSS